MCRKSDRLPPVYSILELRTLPNKLLIMYSIYNSELFSCGGNFCIEEHHTKRNTVHYQEFIRKSTEIIQIQCHYLSENHLYIRYYHSSK